MSDTQKIHSPLGASSAERWMNCPGSIRLIKNAPPSRSSIDAATGTAAHMLAEDIFKGCWDLEAGESPIVVGTVLEVDGYQITVTEEMLDAVRQYTDRCEQLEERTLGGQNYVESTVMIPMTTANAEGWKLTNPTQLFGTVDFARVVPYSKLHIKDYKNGVQPVDAVRSKQMMFYALGVLHLLPQDEREEIPLIEMEIVQPNSKDGKPFKTDTITRKELNEFHVELITAAKATEAPDAPLKSGAWCKYCPAAVTCPELRKELKSISSVAFEEDEKLEISDMPKVENIPVESLIKISEKASIVRDWLNMIEDRMQELADTNPEALKVLNANGYHLQDAYGHSKFADPLAARALLVKALGDEALELISPNKAKKALTKAKLNDIIKLPPTVKPFLRKDLKKGKAGGHDAFAGIDD